MHYHMFVVLYYTEESAYDSVVFPYFFLTSLEISVRFG